MCMCFFTLVVLLSCPHLFWCFPLFTEPGEKSKKVVAFFEHVHRGNTISPPLKELSLAQNMRTHWTNWEDKPLVGSHLKCVFSVLFFLFLLHTWKLYTLNYEMESGMASEETCSHLAQGENFCTNTSYHLAASSTSDFQSVPLKLFILLRLDCLLKSWGTRFGNTQQRSSNIYS